MAINLYDFPNTALCDLQNACMLNITKSQEETSCLGD